MYKYQTKQMKSNKHTRQYGTTPRQLHLNRFTTIYPDNPRVISLIEGNVSRFPTAARATGLSLSL